MNLLHLSKRERFYYHVGEAFSMSNMRCSINLETLEVEIFPSEEFYEFEEAESLSESLADPAKYLLIEPVPSREAFRLMAEFVETTTDEHMRERSADALNGRKPFANFNHLVHTTNIRDDWFDFKGKTYTNMAKEWIDENASPGLKAKIESLPAVRVVE